MLVALSQPTPQRLHDDAQRYGFDIIFVGLITIVTNTGVNGCFGVTGQHLTRTLRSKMMGSFLRCEQDTVNQNKSGLMPQTM